MESRSDPTDLVCRACPPGTSSQKLEESAFRGPNWPSAGLGMAWVGFSWLGGQEITAGMSQARDGRSPLVVPFRYVTATKDKAFGRNRSLPTGILFGRRLVNHWWVALMGLSGGGKLLPVCL